MKIVIPKFGQRLKLLSDWTFELCDGNKINNKFLVTHCGVDESTLRRGFWDERDPSYFRVHFPAGAEFTIRFVAGRKPYYMETLEDSCTVRLAPVRQKKSKAVPPMEVDFDSLALADFEVSDAPAPWHLTIIDALFRGEMASVSAARLAPGTGSKGQLYLFPRGAMTLEELHAKPYIVVANAQGQGFRVGRPVIMEGQTHGKRRHILFGQTRTWARRHKDEQVIGWGTDSPLAALAMSGPTTTIPEE
jgi:hypothetical protein